MKRKNPQIRDYREHSSKKPVGKLFYLLFLLFFHAWFFTCFTSDQWLLSLLVLVIPVKFVIINCVYNLNKSKIDFTFKIFFYLCYLCYFGFFTYKQWRLLEEGSTPIFFLLIPEFIFFILFFSRYWKHRKYLLTLFPFLQLFIPPFIFLGIVASWSQLIFSKGFWILHFYELSHESMILLTVINFASIFYLVWRDGNRWGKLRIKDVVTRSMGLLFVGVMVSIVVGTIFVKASSGNLTKMFNIYGGNEIFLKKLGGIYEEHFYKKNKNWATAHRYFLEGKDRKTGKESEVEVVIGSMGDIFIYGFVCYIIDNKHQLDFNRKDKIIYDRDEKKYKIILLHEHLPGIQLKKVETYEPVELIEYNCSQGISHEFYSGLTFFFSEFFILHLRIIISGSFMALFLGVGIQLLRSRIGKSR